MDIAGFYTENEQRRASDEITYGEDWTTPSDQHATYRGCWVVDTGEFYIIREPHAGGILEKYLDELNIDQADVSELTVEVLATVTDQSRLLSLIDGWEKVVEDDDSLTWLRSRLTAA